MRILNIRGKNLASLAGDFEVDFEHGPLAGAGLYAISGPTGAGKSTLLDALCLALFDRTPRLADQARGAGFEVGREGAADVLPNNDVRAVLRRGASEGLASVEFLGKDGLRYRAEWKVWKARRQAAGKFQAQEMSLTDCASGKVLATKKTEVLEEVVKRVGLTFDQFRRSVLLAQGDFASFLKAKADERAELLERMTGTEIYGVLSVRAHERCKQEHDELQRLDDQAGLHKPLPDEERQAREAELGKAREQRADAKLRVDGLAAALRWFDRLAELVGAERQAEAGQQTAQGAFDAAAPRRDELAEVEKVQPLRSAFETARRAEGEAARVGEESARLASDAEAAAKKVAEAAAKVAEAERGVQEAHAAREALKPQLESARALDHNLDEARRRLADAKAALEAAEKRAAAASAGATAAAERLKKNEEEKRAAATWLDENRFAAALVTSVERVRTIATRYAQQRVQKDRAGKEAGEAAAALKDASKLVESAKEAAEKAEADAGRAATASREASEAFSALNADSLPAQRQALHEREARLERLARCATSAAEGLALEKTLEAAIDGAKQEAAAAEARATSADAERQRLSAAVVEARRLAEQAAVVASLDEHRANLRDGEACPLCGGLEHPYAKSLPKQVLAGAESHLASLEKKLEKLTRDAGEAAAQAVAAREKAGERSHAREEARRGLEQCERDWVRDADSSLPPKASDPESASRVSAALEVVRRDLKDLHAREQACADARRRAEAAQRKAGAAAEAAKVTAKALADAQTTLTALEGKVDRLSAAVAECEGQLRVCLDDLTAAMTDAETGWRSRLESSPKQFVGWCEQLATEARDWRRRLDEAGAALTELSAQSATAATEARTAEADLGRAKDLASTAEATHAQLARERAALFDGRPTSEVERTAEERVRLADQHAQRASTESQAAVTSAASAKASSEACASRHRDCLAALADARAALAGALAQLGVAADEVTRRLERSADWRREEAAALKSLETALEQARTVRSERVRAREAHERSGRPEDPPEVVGPAREAAQQAFDEVHRRETELTVLLAQDDQARETAKTLAKAIDEKRKRADLWRSVADLIGSADGKKFRVFAQSLTLDALLAHANLQLRELAPRYVLERVPGHDLDLQVVDQDMGGEVRSVNSLSGGETFLVSLALALGLSSLASDRVRIESLFVDEGFGTLDPATLEVALATLDALQAAGRKVGLISHVPGLAERIGVQICVTPRGAGRSEVTVVAGSAAAAA